jgi:hypothetical protein
MYARHARPSHYHGDRKTSLVAAVFGWRQIKQLANWPRNKHPVPKQRDFPFDLSCFSEQNSVCDFAGDKGLVRRKVRALTCMLSHYRHSTFIRISE